MTHHLFLINYIRKFKSFIWLILAALTVVLVAPCMSYSYPIFAQQAYENPREATGRIVCANCHLAQKDIEVEVPKSVLPNSVFEAKVKVPYKSGTTQLLGSGTKGPFNVGAVLVFPEGFKLAPSDTLSEELKEKTKGVYIQPYSSARSNILVVGPLYGEKNREIVFPILAPDPNTDKNVHFVKYPVYAGGNRGRGQLYPSGDKSNNNVYTASVKGEITKIENLEKKGVNLFIKTTAGEEVKQTLPAGLELIVEEGDSVQVDQALNLDPNKGGFGQAETEIVLQSPTHIIFLILFFFSVVIAQTFLLLKKKQFEKVQAAEMNL